MIHTLLDQIESDAGTVFSDTVTGFSERFHWRKRGEKDGVCIPAVRDDNPDTLLMFDDLDASSIILLVATQYIPGVAKGDLIYSRSINYVVSQVRDNGTGMTWLVIVRDSNV